MEIFSIMKKLLIINKVQFGYHIDSYKYCQYLKNNFDITYLCFDTGKQKVQEENINIIYIPHEKTFLNKGFNFIKICRHQIKHQNYDIVFIVHFLMSSFIKIGIMHQKFILDIRTNSVNTNKYKRFIHDQILKIDSLFFKNITIISECLKKKLKISEAHILPLGSDPITSTDKKYINMHLLYVGTLNGREIHKTITGLAQFISYYKTKNFPLVVTYDIIGYGKDYEEKQIIDTIQKYNLMHIITFHGRKTHSELTPFFKKANIGISYVPNQEHFRCQPPTKTFEYINSGLFCIATNTDANKNLISQENGLICEDSVDSFYNSLLKFQQVKSQINTQAIRKTLKDYHWNKIITNNLYCYLTLIGNKS